MYKKIIAMVLIAAMTVTLAACGGSKQSETTNQTETTEQAETADSTSEEQTVEETVSEDTEEKPADSVFSMYDFANPRSAVITFDPEKVEIVGLHDGQMAEIVLIDNHDVILYLECNSENLSVQDLYDQRMGWVLEDDSITVTELAETPIGNGNLWRSDAVWKDGGAICYQIFILELENGLLLTGEFNPGYDEAGNPLLSLDEMLSYVFVDVVEGDGTPIIPAAEYSFDNDGDVLNISFRSGESVALDYDQNVLQVTSDTSYVNVKAQEAASFVRGSELRINRYSSADDFFEDKGEYGLTQISKYRVSGQNLGTVAVGSFTSGDPLCYIDLGNGYALWGNYRADDNEGRSAEEFLTALLGPLEADTGAAAGNAGENAPAVEVGDSEFAILNSDKEAAFIVSYDSATVEMSSGENVGISLLAEWAEEGNSASIFMQHGSYESTAAFRENLDEVYTLNSDIYGDFEMTDEETKQYGGVEVYMAEYSFSGMWEDSNVEFCVGIGTSDCLWGEIEFTDMETAHAVLEDLLLTVEKAN